MSKKKSKRKAKDMKMSKNLDAKFTEVYGERFGNETIIDMNIADADFDYTRLFGANKNLYRVVPSLIDGLKPSKRRLLYSWWELEGRPQNTNRETLNKFKVRKVDHLMSTTQMYHPHGTTAIGDIIAEAGQPWLNNVMLLEPQGSSGNMYGNKAAAGRYRGAKMSEFTIDCFFDDFDKYCVATKLVYTGDAYEPEILPAKYPFVLFNPQFSSIGFGLASSIPSFNVTEVLDATIKLIKDPDAKIMLIPDIPTGCDIIDHGKFKEINKTGKGKLTMRATADIDYVNSKITITSLPYDSTSKNVVVKIAEYKQKGQFNDIVEIHDFTQEGTVKIDIYLKSSAKPDKVLQELYKKGIGLKTTYPIGIIVIDDYQDYEFGIKELLLQWIDYRIDMCRSMFLNNLQVITSKQHMTEVLLMVFNKDNIDTTIKIAKESKSRKETIERLMKKFKITSVQAATIADMHVYNFNEDSYNRYLDDYDKYKKELKNINDILDDDSKLEDFIIKQLEEGKKKWGHPRKSKIIKENDDSMDDIPNTDHLVGISETGYIKKLPIKKATSIGHVGKINSNLYVFQANNRENILVVDSSGVVSKISLSAVPNMDVEDVGVELSKFFTVNGHIKAVMELPTMDILNIDDESLGLIFLTKKGICKKVKLSEFNSITDKKLGISLNKNDEVGAALFAVDSGMKDIIICTNKGRGIRLPLSEIRTFGISAKGLQMITLNADEEVISASLINPKKKLLFYVTSSGRAKVTDLKFFPVMDRKDEPVNLIGLNDSETLVGVGSCEKNDTVMIYKKKSEPETLEIKSFTPTTRAAKGDKVIKTARGDVVIDFRIFSSK